MARHELVADTLATRSSLDEQDAFGVLAACKTLASHCWILAALGVLDIAVMGDMFKEASSFNNGSR